MPRLPARAEWLALTLLGVAPWPNTIQSLKRYAPSSTGSVSSSPRSSTTERPNVTYIFATDQPLICRNIQKWRINKAGYDSIGSYWGAGVPVWTADLYFAPTNRKFHVDATVRAKTKTEAKKKLKERFPAIKKFVLD